MSGEHLDRLLDDLKRRAARQSLKGQLVHVYSIVDNKRVTVPHIAVPGVGLVALTPQQIAELEDSNG